MKHLEKVTVMNFRDTRDFKKSRLYKISRMASGVRSRGINFRERSKDSQNCETFYLKVFEVFKNPKFL